MLLPIWRAKELAERQTVRAELAGVRRLAKMSGMRRPARMSGLARLAGLVRIGIGYVRLAKDV